MTKQPNRREPNTYELTVARYYTVTRPAKSTAAAKATFLESVDAATGDRSPATLDTLFEDAIPGAVVCVYARATPAPPKPKTGKPKASPPGTGKAAPETPKEQGE